jgi:hypothetical protein
MGKNQLRNLCVHASIESQLHMWDPKPKPLNPKHIELQ